MGKGFIPRTNLPRFPGDHFDRNSGVLTENREIGDRVIRRNALNMRHRVWNDVVEIRSAHLSELDCACNVSKLNINKLQKQDSYLEVNSSHHARAAKEAPTTRSNSVIDRFGDAAWKATRDGSQPSSADN